MALVVRKVRGRNCNNRQYLRGQACTRGYLVANHLRGRVNHFRHSSLHKGWWDDDTRPLAIWRGFLRVENWFQLWFLWILKTENLHWFREQWSCSAGPGILFTIPVKITVSKMFRWQLWLLVFSPVARPWRVPEGTRLLNFQVTTRTLPEKFYYSSE